MTKEELLAKISEKLGKTSLSERTLNSYVGNIVGLVSDDSQVDDKFLTSHVSILKSIEGQLSHDIAEGISKNEANKKPLEINQGNEDSPTDKILKMIAEIKEDNTKLRESLEQEKALKNEQFFKNAVKEAMKNKGAKSDYILKQTIAQKKFDVNKSVEEAAEEALKDYDKNYKECFGDGATPRCTENNNQSNDEIKKSLDAFFEKKASEGKFPTSKN